MVQFGEFIPSGVALDLRPDGEIIVNPEKALVCYRLDLESLENIYRAYGPPGYSTYRSDWDRGSAKPWPPKNPAEAERLVREARAKAAGRRRAGRAA